MDWIQFAIMIVSFVGLFIWNRTKSRSDMRHMDTKIDAIRNLTVSFHEAIREDMKAIHEDMKDFHGRLCDLEARRK